MKALRILAMGAALALGALLTAACPPAPPPGVVYVKARPPVQIGRAHV